MAKSNHEKVETAIKKIEEFHALGLSLPKKLSHKEVYRRQIIEHEGEQLRVNQDTLRKARGFADPVEGYTTEELNDLCDLIREVQPGRSSTARTRAPTCRGRSRPATNGGGPGGPS